MRTSAVALLVALLLAPQVSYGWKGGPWSNSSLETTRTDGTYKATFTGENLIGVTVFGSSATSEDTGRYFCWLNGKTSYGVTQAVIDPEMGQVSGVFMPTALVSVYSPAGDTTAANEWTSVQGINNGAATGEFSARVTNNDYKFVFKGTGHMSQAIGGDDSYLFSPATGSQPATANIINPGFLYVVSIAGAAITVAQAEIPEPERELLKFTISGVRTSTQPYRPVSMLDSSFTTTTTTGS